MFLQIHIHTKNDLKSTHSRVDENEEIASVEFCECVKVNLLREKNAYLSKVLLEDVIN